MDNENDIVYIANAAAKLYGDATSRTIKEGVTVLANNLFGGSQVENVYLPDSLKGLSQYCFSNCHSLKDVRMPSSLEEIGSYSFYHCCSLSGISIPDTVNEIGSHAFEYCSGLTEIDLPENLNRIGQSAFEYCYGLTELTIPGSVKNIGYGAFGYCRNLRKVVVEDGVTSIGSNYIFRGSSPYSVPLKELRLGKTVTNASDLGFYAYSSDQVNAEIVEVNSAFRSYTTNDFNSIEEYIIGKDFPDTGAKNDMAWITRVTGRIVIDENNPYYETYDNGKYLIRKSTKALVVAVPGGTSDLRNADVELLGNYLFDKPISNLQLPTSLKTIGNYSFSGAMLTKLVIPENVELIKNAAFAGAFDNSRSGETGFGIYVYASTPPAVETYTFYEGESWYSKKIIANIYVPRDMVETYKTAWPIVDNKIYAIPTGA